MLSILKEHKEHKEKKLKVAREKQLKTALAEKCANMDDQYVSHDEDKSEYTIFTINGKTMKVKKEEITIESP
jgi:hypothetical protein